MGYPVIRHKVAEFVITNRGRNVTVDEIKKALNLTSEQVKAAMYNIMSSGTMPGLVSVVKARIWRYDDTPVLDPRGTPINPTEITNSIVEEKLTDKDKIKYTLVGKAKLGVIVQDDEGNLYSLTRI